MKKIFILDTSVLAHDPFAYKTFVGSEVILPINVLEEIDKLKTFPNEVGKHARVFIRKLDEICQQGDITQGIIVEKKTTLKISTDHLDANAKGYADNAILSCAAEIKNKNKRAKVTLVTRDINLRVRAKALKLEAENYEKDGVEVDDLYSGFKTIVNNKLGRQLADLGTVESTHPAFSSLLPNECIFVQSEEGTGLALGRKVGAKVELIDTISPWGLSTRNKEQALAVDMLTDTRLPLVTMVGKAGCGKTLIALACALEMVLEQKRYQKLVIYRPIQPLGKQDIGYLPGTASEKLSPWMGPIMDSLELLFGGKKNSKWKEMLEMYQEKGIIQMDALSYIRGRSIPNAFILIDEAQNLSKDEIKTILTRIGTGSRCVLTGDIHQIDNTALDAMNNGLSYAIEKFKNYELAGHITFTKGERSELATLASEIL